MVFELTRNAFGKKSAYEDVVFIYLKLSEVSWFFHNTLTGFFHLFLPNFSTNLSLSLCFIFLL